MKLSNMELIKQKKSITSIIKKIWKWITKFFNILSIFTILIQIFILLILSTTNPELLFTFIFIFFFLDTAIALMTSKKSLESQILNISFIVLSVSSLVIYGIIYYIKIYYIPLYPNLLHIGTVDSWIGFAGSILSGLLVMMSLVFTIKHERQVRDEDKKNELIPFIEIDTECYSEETQEKTLIFNIENPWYLKITNIGNNAARNIKIVELKAWFYEINNERNAVSCNLLFKSKSSLFTSLIVSDKFHEIDIQLQSSNLPEHYYNGLRLYFFVEYYDLTLKNIHKQSATINLISIQSKEDFCKLGYKNWSYSEKANNFIE